VKENDNMRQELLETVMANEKIRSDQEKALHGVRTELSDTKAKLEDLLRKYGLLDAELVAARDQSNKDMDKSFRDQLAAKDRELKAQMDAALNAKNASDKAAADVINYISYF
jgi:hypothetical protein